jgi:hypothetical protein
MLAIHDAGDFQDLCQRLSNDDQEVDIVSLTKFEQGFGYLISDQDARSLAQCLAQNSHVMEMYINITNLSVRGGIALMPFVLSSPNLEILGLQGSTDDEEEDDPDTQMIVVDVLIRAAIQNLNHLALEIQNCPIARSSLMVSMHSDSHLSEISIGAGHCPLIVDDADPIFEELAYSTDLKVMNIVQNGEDSDLSEFLFKCSVYLPRVERIFLNGNRSIPLKLARSRSLLDFSYMNESVPCNVDSIISIIEFIEKADNLRHIYLHLLALDEFQKRNLCGAFRRNRSLTSVWLRTPISDELSICCERNRIFLKHWQDLKIRIPPSVFAFAAEVSTQSNAGRTFLFQRLPLLLTKA